MHTLMTGERAKRITETVPKRLSRWHKMLTGLWWRRTTHYDAWLRVSDSTRTPGEWHIFRLYKWHRKIEVATSFVGGSPLAQKRKVTRHLLFWESEEDPNGPRT